jgi:iron(III) transport system substrate-binding protein
MIKGAPHPENAQRFLEFLASDQAQEMFSKGNHEFPVVDGVETDEVLASWGDFKRDDLNVSVLGENNPKAVRIFDRVGWR